MFRGVKNTLKVQSSAFSDGERMPEKYTADGSNISPPLSWEPGPGNTKSYAIVATDPDAPSPRLPLFNWVHWVVFNIPAEVTSMGEAVAPSPGLDNGVQQGKNSYRNFGYGGPNPPFGEHRYIFTVYAVSTRLDLDSANANKKKVIKALDGHVLAQGQLTGTYSKKK